MVWQKLDLHFNTAVLGAPVCSDSGVHALLPSLNEALIATVTSFSKKLYALSVYSSNISSKPMLTRILGTNALDGLVLSDIDTT